MKRKHITLASAIILAALGHANIANANTFPFADLFKYQVKVLVATGIWKKSTVTNNIDTYRTILTQMQTANDTASFQSGIDTLKLRLQNQSVFSMTNPLVNLLDSAQADLNAKKLDSLQTKLSTAQEHLKDIEASL